MTGAIGATDLNHSEDPLMTHLGFQRNAVQPDLATVLPHHIGSLVDALEGILPALHSIASGGTPRLTRCASTYAEAPPPWVEVDECMYGIRVRRSDPVEGEEYLNLDELGFVVDALAHLRETWLLKAGPEAFAWKKFKDSE
jgi:hypothetical protein